MGQVFSTEVPELFPDHLNHLAASAISINVIRERGYKSILAARQLESLGFSKAQRRAPGLLIPLYAPDGSPAGCQYRPDKPRENAKGKPIKYETPQGTAIRLDMPPRCREFAGHPEVELWITEGAKKADALATHGACAINLCGVWGFKGRNEFGATTFLADFDLIAWEERRVFIVFDSDIITKAPVRQAMQRLKVHIERKGSNVAIVRLPEEI